MTRARELSKLVNDAVFSIDANNNIGVNSTTPDAKFDVVGIVSATAFYGDGSNLSGAGSALEAASGSQRVVVTSLTSGTMTSAATDSDLAYNASTNTLSATNFSGALSGNATGLSGTPNIDVGVATATSFNGNLTGTASEASAAASGSALETSINNKTSPGKAIALSMVFG